MTRHIGNDAGLLSYKIKLHFCDLQSGAASGGVVGYGRRGSE